MLLPFWESTLTRYPTRNRLLQKLSPDDLALLEPLVQVSLPLRTPLEIAGEPLEFAYFVEDGVASIVLENLNRPIEVGLAGNEGMTGAGLVANDRLSPFHTYMQVAGSATRIETDRLVAACEASGSLRGLLLRYNRALSIQVAATASANGRAKLDERLARWLLMVGDRTGTTFHITHEFISIMLGVRRSGVTLAMQTLEGKGLIKANRGSITILDRDGLIEESSGAYGLPEREYERLLG
jgi:CRP-like cAMP-binding protein